MPDERTASMMNFDRAADQGLSAARFHACQPHDRLQDVEWFMRQPRLLVPLVSAALWLLLVAAGSVFHNLLI